MFFYIKKIFYIHTKYTHKRQIMHTLILSFNHVFALNWSAYIVKVNYQHIFIATLFWNAAIYTHCTTHYGQYSLHSQWFEDISTTTILIRSTELTSSQLH